RTPTLAGKRNRRGSGLENFMAWRYPDPTSADFMDHSILMCGTAEGRVEDITCPGRCAARDGVGDGDGGASLAPRIRAGKVHAGRASRLRAARRLGILWARTGAPAEPTRGGT